MNSRWMRNKAKLLAAGILALWAGSGIAAGEVQMAGRISAQLERMRDPLSQERLFFSVGEIAALSGASEARVLASGLCVVRVDGVALVPVGAARRYLWRSSHVSQLESPLPAPAQ